MARRRGGGGRQERTKSPAAGGGVHPAGAQRSGAPGSAQRAGLHPVAAGLQGRDAPRHLGAEADTAAQPKRGDNRRGATGGPTGPAKLAGPSVSDRTGSADETAAPARHALRKLRESTTSEWMRNPTSDQVDDARWRVQVNMLPSRSAKRNAGPETFLP